MNDLVKDKVASLVGDQTMFTAYDVTVSLRNDGERVKHNEVRAVVHQLFQNEEAFDAAYDRTSVQVPGTNATAFLFHHLNSDVDEYQPIAKTYDQNAPAQTATAVVTKTVRHSGQRNKQPVDGKIDGMFQRSDGDLNVPSVLLKEAGINPPFAIVVKSDSLLIVDEETSKDYDNTVVLRNPTGTHDVRIPAKLVNDLPSDDHADTYSMQVSGNTIEVTRE